MNKYNFVIWILMPLIIEAVFIFIRIKYSVHLHSKMSFILTLIKAILFVVIAFVTISIDNVFTVRTTYLFGAMYIVILSDTIANIIMRIINIFYKNNNLVAYNILALVVMIIIFKTKLFDI